MLRTHPLLILVTHPSCANLTNSIKCMGDSRSYTFLTTALIMHYLAPPSHKHVCGFITGN